MHIYRVVIQRTLVAGDNPETAKAKVVDEVHHYAADSMQNLLENIKNVIDDPYKKIVNITEEDNVTIVPPAIPPAVVFTSEPGWTKCVLGEEEKNIHYEVSEHVATLLVALREVVSHVKWMDEIKNWANCTGIFNVEREAAIKALGELDKISEVRADWSSEKLDHYYQTFTTGPTANQELLVLLNIAANTRSMVTMDCWKSINTHKHFLWLLQALHKLKKITSPDEAKQNEVNEYLEKELIVLRKIAGYVDGLSHGVDWNNGTHAKAYRGSLIKAISEIYELRATYDQDEVSKALSHNEEWLKCDVKEIDLLIAIASAAFWLSKSDDWNGSSHSKHYGALMLAALTDYKDYMKTMPVPNIPQDQTFANVKKKAEKPSMNFRDEFIQEFKALEKVARCADQREVIELESTDLSKICQARQALFTALEELSQIRADVPRRKRTRKMLNDCVVIIGKE